ncbi:hypothetical protein [Streptomyces sp. NPDC048489]|uniref:hypothetical protein n=1 Tax=Streptomyces sp. NPDC048489 TaxID=3154504 RepID=UPI0034199383
MSTDAVVNIILLIAGIAILIPKRTRPLVTLVAIAWLAKQAFILHQDHETAASFGCVISILALIANWVIYRKKYMAELKG